MARSPVSNLGEFLRKDGSVTMVGVQRPRSPKITEKKFTFAGGKNEDWNTVSNAVTALFQRKKLAKSELSSLTEKVKSVKQEVGGSTICEWFKESLVKGMIILREDVKDKNGEVLLDKLADSWTYFFCTILPLLQAIFLDIQSREAQSTRSIALLNFRDVVVLKTKLEEAFVMDLTVPPKVAQMLLILQGVHDDLSSRNYRKLEHLISFVVSPYLSSTGLRTKPVKPSLDSKKSETEELKNKSETASHSEKKPRPFSVGSLELQSKYSADRLHETALQSGPNRRFTFAADSLNDSSHNSVFGPGTSTLT